MTSAWIPFLARVRAELEALATHEQAERLAGLGGVVSPTAAAELHHHHVAHLDGLARRS